MVLQREREAIVSWLQNGAMAWRSSSHHSTSDITGTLSRFDLDVIIALLWKKFLKSARVPYGRVDTMMGMIKRQRGGTQEEEWWGADCQVERYFKSHAFKATL
ncbi:hypothetical protein CBL_10468 [Carabus blaptoides fortunei]